MGSFCMIRLGYGNLLPKIYCYQIVTKVIGSSAFYIIFGTKIIIIINETIVIISKIIIRNNRNIRRNVMIRDNYTKGVEYYYIQK